MNTKGILMSEKDCKPQRKEKTAKKSRDVENNKDDEDEEDALMKNITLNELTKLALDSESEAAKKFGCGTTRFKTICRKFGIIRWPHRKLHSLLEMYKSLAGYYQELCEKANLDPENASTMEVLKFTKKDLDRLREYAFQVERNVFLLNEYHHSKPKNSKPWPEDILRIRATIYKQRHVHSKHMKRKSKKSSSASQNLLEEEKEMAPTAPCSMTTSRTTTNNISSKSANDTTCNTTTYSSEESVEMSGVDTAFNHHQMVDVSCGTRTLTSDAETNTYLNNSYAFVIENNEMSSGYIENEDDHCDDEDQYQTHRGHPSLPPSFKNTNTKTKMMYTTTSAANSEYSSGSGVDFFNAAPNFIINNDNNENGQNSVGGRKRKKPTSSFSAARSKLSKRAAANNNKKGGETEEELPSNTALAFSMPHMLNMDAIFGIDGSVERDDEDTALSPNSYGITIASFKETKRM
ncbi:unnamed protein product [Bathycoccus prasinos]